MWLQKLVACFDAADLRGTQAEREQGTVSHRELMQLRMMIRKQWHNSLRLTLFYWLNMMLCKYIKMCTPYFFWI